MVQRSRDPNEQIQKTKKKTTKKPKKPVRKTSKRIYKIIKCKCGSETKGDWGDSSAMSKIYTNHNHSMNSNQQVVTSLISFHIKLSSGD